ncbi:streptophobe family protein [Streptomyces sp. NPDC048290]|uniref:streptophobe family protein n=1 Tax=Streptomyces sp. NPDC048290 TaxID=3155811 RepID=UPI003442CBE6
MTAPGPTPSPSAAPPGGADIVRHGWFDALFTVVAGLVAMAVVAALGLWAAGAPALPDAAYPRVVAATMVTAVGGALRMRGDAGGLATTDAGLSVVPLSVTLAGALVIATGFLRPLRHRAVVDPAGLAGWTLRIAVLWVPALLGLAFAARQMFRITLGEGAARRLTELFGISPEVGFTTDVPRTVLFGLLWLAGVLLPALLVTRRAPLTGAALRLHASVRPVAYAMVGLALVVVAVGVVIGLVVAASRGHTADTFAVLLLGLPNLVWLVFTLGLGVTWHGRVDGPFGLPMPRLLDQVLRGPDVSTLNLRTLAEYDGRVWWLVVVDAVLLLGAAAVLAARSPARTPLWRLGLRMAAGLVLTVLAMCLLCRISAHYGLSVLGIGGLGDDLAGDLFLRPGWWPALGLAALWGLVAGCAGGLLVAGVRRAGGLGGIPPTPDAPPRASP